MLNELSSRFPDAYIIPEGGSNALAVQGCEEILSLKDKQDYDFICCAVGTGGTVSGIINASAEKQMVYAVAALKGEFLQQQIQQWTNKNNWQLISDDRFGGYGRYDAHLEEFIAKFDIEYGIELEPIYTGKAMYWMLDMIQQGKIAKGS